MSVVLDVLPQEQMLSAKLEPLFTSPAAYGDFREWYIEGVSEELERLQEARRKSEEESRQRLLR